MKKNLNESYHVCLDVTAMNNDNPNTDFNELRDSFINAGANIDKDEINGHLIMVVNGLTNDVVIDIANDVLYDEFDPMYIVNDNISDRWNFEDNSCEIDESDFPAYEDVDEYDFPEYDDINEKRKKCCPGKTVNEKLKAFNDKDQNKLNGIEKSVKDIISDINSTTIGAHEAREAFKKLRAENAKLRKIQKSEDSKFTVNDVVGVKKALNTIKKADAENAKEVDKFQKSIIEKVNNHLAKGKSYLHENVKYKGVSFKDMNVFELKALYDKTLKEKENLSKDIKNTLNESAFTDIKNRLQKKNQLIDLLDEELTYRVVRQRCLKHLTEGVDLNEDGGEITDKELANLFGPAQGEETTDTDTKEETNNDSEKKSSEETDDNSTSEEDEEVELSRIEITLKNREAAEDLKQACLDADIPEDAIEIEDSEESDEDEEESEEDETENSEDETTEDNEESEEDNANESLYYGNINKLLYEGENASEETDENNTDEESEDNTDEESEDTDNEESEEEKNVKFILTNTDYALQLANVLNDQYGISKEEFEDMIGGEIVDESDDEESNDDDSTDDEKNEESKDDESKDDEMDPSELFKGL